MTKVKDKEEISRMFDSDYKEAMTNWSDAYNQMEIDAFMYVGNQWDEDDKAFLTEEGRSIYVYNYTQRDVNMIVGNQRKNRLGYGVDPVESNDEDTSDFLNSLLIWQANQSNVYHTISDSFEETAITGLSILSLSIDYNNDLVSGDIKVTMHPFQSIVLDSNFTKMDLSDCRYAIQRTIMSKDAAKGYIPHKANEIEDLPSGIDDQKFTYLALSKLTISDDMVAYDEYYRRAFKKVKVVINKQTGEMQNWEGSAEELKMLLEVSPDAHVITKMEPCIEYYVFVQGELMHVGEEPLGIKDYPFVPVLWTYKPYLTDYSYKIQGMVRAIRDPQIEYNRRRSQLVDIVASQINSGWIVSEGAVKNQDDLFKTGQGQVIEINQGRSIADIQKINPTEVSQSLISLTQQLTTDMLQIPGLNDEAIGTNDAGNTQISGNLAQQRLSNSLTVLKTPIDKLEMAQKLLGIKILKAMLKNYAPSKLARIAGREAPEGLTAENVIKYDVAVKETMLTDTQRTLAFYQGMQALQAGLPIPPEFLMKIYPTSDKAELLEMFKAQEQASQAQQQKVADQEALSMKLANAEVVHKLSLGEMEREKGAGEQMLSIQRMASADADRSKANLDNIKAAMEIQGIGQQQLIEALNFLSMIDQQTKGQDVALMKQSSRESEQDMVSSNQLNSQQQQQQPQQQQNPLEQLAGQ